MDFSLKTDEKILTFVKENKDLGVRKLFRHDCTRVRAKQFIHIIIHISEPKKLETSLIRQHSFDIVKSGPTLDSLIKF